MLPRVILKRGNIVSDVKWTKEYRREYARKYYKEHREEAKAKAKDYRKKNADAIAEYNSQETTKAKKRECIARRRCQPGYVQKERQVAKENIQKNRMLVNKVQMHYGCQNHLCMWKGEYNTSMLDFHHLEPQKKRFQISLGLNRSTPVLAEEVNKCVVLCRNCHALLHCGIVQVSHDKLCKVNENCELNS